METLFGWVLLGNAQTFDKQITSQPVSCHLTSLSTPSLDHIIRKFWEIESLPSKQFLSPEEEKCETFYQRTVTRYESGRFQVSLPFRHSRPDLGDTYAKAHKCSLSLESKLLKNPALYEQYADVKNSYIKNDYMNDICSGADSIESALALQKDLIALLKSGCFELVMMLDY
nr:unnamed protein product [Callosobruchus analis]